MTTFPDMFVFSILDILVLFFWWTLKINTLWQKYEDPSGHVLIKPIGQFHALIKHSVNSVVTSRPDTKRLFLRRIWVQNQNKNQNQNNLVENV